MSTWDQRESVELIRPTFLSARQLASLQELLLTAEIHIRDDVLYAARDDLAPTRCRIDWDSKNEDERATQIHQFVAGCKRYINRIPRAHALVWDEFLRRAILRQKVEEAAIDDLSKQYESHRQWHIRHAAHVCHGGIFAENRRYVEVIANEQQLGGGTQYGWLMLYREHIRPWLRLAEDPDSAAQVAAGGGKSRESGAWQLEEPNAFGRGETDKLELPWDNAAEGFVTGKEAVALSKGKLNPPALSKALTPTGTMRYMRKGQRCKIHLEDLRTYLESLADERDSFEIVDEYVDEVERRKTEASRQRASGE